MGFARESQLSFWSSQDRKTFIFIELWDCISVLRSAARKDPESGLWLRGRKDAQRERMVLSGRNPEHSRGRKTRGKTKNGGINAAATPK